MSLKFKLQSFEIKFIIVVLGIAFFFLACAQNDVKKGNFVIAQSKTFEASMFRQHCAICHGPEGNGKVMDGRVIPSLRRAETASKPEQVLYNQIYNGGNGMLPFKGQLSEEEVRRMAKFVKEDLQGNN